MSILDWIYGRSETAPADTVPAHEDPLVVDQRERDYITKTLGQKDPGEVLLVDPRSAVDKPERDIEFPKGLPDKEHSGALAQLARNSMGSSDQGPPQTQVA